MNYIGQYLLNRAAGMDTTEAEKAISYEREAYPAGDEVRDQLRFFDGEGGMCAEECE